MKTKIFLIGCAIIMIAVLFAVPALREGGEAERYDGRPFPDRSNQTLQSAQSPTFVEPPAIDLNALTASDVAPSVSSNYGNEFSIQPVEAPTNTFTLDAPSSSRDSDSLIVVKDESPFSQSNEVYVDTLAVDAAPPVVEDWTLETVDESVGLELDELELANENPFDRPIQLPATPLETPVPAIVNNDSVKLPAIQTGTGFAPFGTAQSRVEVNPYVSDNSARLASRDHIRRPIAKPRFDQTPITAIGSTGTAGNGSNASSHSLPTSILLPSENDTAPIDSNSSPSDANQSIETPVPLGSVNSSELIAVPVPVDAPVEVRTSPLMEPAVGSTPAFTNDAPVVPNHGVPIESGVAPIQNTMNVATFNQMNPSVDSFSGSSYLQNSWTPSIFQADGCRGGNDCESGSLGEGSWGDTSSTLSVGGWVSAGYHGADNQLFNNRPDKFALHQGWLYAEKSATSDSPIGFRVDAMYGIDGTDTQAFGNEPGNWDYLNGLDFGAYSWAIPQAYLDVAIGEFNVRVGHFFTLIGYETVPAPDNFFYSHAITMYNSEPFTHTGVLVNRTFGDFDVYGGWTLGWDTGYDRFGDGGSWLGGFTYEMSDDASFSYFSTAGDFGARGDDGYSQSVVLNLSLTENVNYVLQSDYLRVASTGEDNVGVAQFMTYSVTDKISFGSRLEWWKGDVLTGYAPHGGTLPAFGSLSYFATTFGANIKPTDSFVIRPEIRHDWSPAADYDETYFGIDAVWSF